MTLTFDDYVAYGGCREMWSCRDTQVLFEGPAGTGKTRSILERRFLEAERFPGSRHLFVRQTRESMTESILWTWEDEVLPEGHPIFEMSQAHRARRQNYTWPNGSEVIVRGLDKPGKTYSSQYDTVTVFEGWETSMDAWERLGRCMRNEKMPYRQRLMDTNPASEYCWVNQMAEEGLLTRIRTTHHDNPRYWDHDNRVWTPLGLEYVEGTLKSLTGARYRNLYKGEWASEEGAIWEEFDPGTHILEGDSERWPLTFDWYFASFDKGLRHPGCLMVWGCNDDRIYCVAEVYRTGWDLDQWTSVVLELDEEFPLQTGVCDPSEPEYIQVFNERLLNRKKGRYIWQKAQNALDVGIDMVRWGLSVRDSGPRIFWLKDRLRYGRDEFRKSQRKPCSSTEEVPSYVWCKSEEGKPIKEKPDPTCSDHGCDAVRYASMFKWGRDMTPAPEPKKHVRGSYGQVMEFAKTEKAIEEFEKNRWAVGIDDDLWRKQLKR